ncbi:hypothetical protein [Paraburkholderia caribensis]|uniref:hypothetical protein n=1 Tax=Paraburkholderia caribensis TaxID=75105 RepID=UPI00285455D0|nr:hypothetical protein [Paraburkholderia caribensis]MDR6382082.1 hypothetical protein [Paraburkholderia caribensis]
MASTLKQFYLALDREEAAIQESLSEDRRGLFLKAAISELDWYCYNYALRGEPNSEEVEQFYLFQLGVARLIQLSLDAAPAYVFPSVMFRRDASIALPVLEIIGGLGMIEHGRRVAQSVASGLCSIERVAEDEYRISLPTLIPDQQYYERAISDHYRDQHRKQIESLTVESEFGMNIALEVKKHLVENVYPFQEHFIGYDATPLLDDYFFALAFIEVQLADGYDSFNGAVRFGNVRYRNYLLALTFLVSISMRHERFAEALVEKHRDVKLENVLTVTADTGGFIESLMSAVNRFGEVDSDFEPVTMEEAQTMFDVLSVGRSSTDLLGRPGAALPIIVQSSDQGFIRCVTAARLAPVQFLLDSLRFHFPKDYAKHQQTREGAMQAAVKRALNSGFSTAFEYRENIKVRLNGRELTDIDLVIIEKKTNTVVLCQLKHQELFGQDLRAQEVRTSRLRQQIATWLSALDTWVNSVGDGGICASLRLPRQAVPLRVLRLIITRHYSFPLADLALDDTTAHGTWLQLVNSLALIRSDAGSAAALGDLIPQLKKMEAPGGVQTHIDEPRSEWIIDRLKFTIMQKSAVGET